MQCLLLNICGLDDEGRVSAVDEDEAQIGRSLLRVDDEGLHVLAGLLLDSHRHCEFASLVHDFLGHRQLLVVDALLGGLLLDLNLFVGLCMLIK